VLLLQGAVNLIVVLRLALDGLLLALPLELLLLFLGVALRGCGERCAGQYCDDDDIERFHSYGSPGWTLLTLVVVIPRHFMLSHGRMRQPIYHAI